MEGMRRMLSYVRRCVDDYEMIHPQDKIAVGLSGGKDSLALLVTLSELRRFYPHSFSLCAITVDMGFSDGTDYHWVQELCDRLEVPFYIQTSQIAQVIFDVRKDHNPCSLCAKMRRGLLNRTATQLGYSKVALGHHFDDVVETFMLNLFQEGRLGTFSPVTYLSRTNVTVIRPMLYAPEKAISYFVRKNQLPVVKSTCPADGKTKREEMKLLLRQLERENKGLKHRIFHAMQKAGLDGLCMTKLKQKHDNDLK